MSFIPSVMDGGAYGSSIPSPPTESLSSHSTVDLVTDSPSDAVPLFPQGPFFEDEGPQTNSWLLDIPLTLLNPQQCPTRLHPSILSTPTQGVDERARTSTPYPESPVHEEDLPVVCPSRSDSSSWTTASPWFTQSSYFPGAPPIDLASANITLDWHQEEVTTSVQGRRYTRTDGTTNYSEPSIVSSIPRRPTVEQGQAQMLSPNRPHELQRQPGAAVSSQSSQRPATTSGTQKDPMGRYLCNVCGKSYLKPSGLRRHQREGHEPSLCTYCGVFEWGRPYRLREHLKERHPGVDIEAALDEATRMRRRATGSSSHRGE